MRNTKLWKECLMRNISLSILRINSSDYSFINLNNYTVWPFVWAGFWCCIDSSSEQKSNLQSAVFPQKRAVSNRAPTLILLRNDAVIYFTHMHRQKEVFHVLHSEIQMFKEYQYTHCEWWVDCRQVWNVQSDIIINIKRLEIW